MVKRLTIARVALAASSGVLVAGCANHHGMTYTVTIDPAFSGEQTEGIIAATDAWQRAVPGLTLMTRVSTCGSDDTHAICFFIDDAAPSSDVVALTTWDSHCVDPAGCADQDDATTHVYRSKLPAMATAIVFQNMATHELGHAMTQDGSHLSTGNVMEPKLSNDAVGLTADDVAYFWSAR
jgi:hypothetical protein